MDPADSAKLAREAVTIPWDEVRAARVQKRFLGAAGAPAAAPRGVSLRRWSALIAAALVFALAVFVVVRPRERVATTRLEFSDGSFVEPGPDARVVPEVVSPTLVAVRQTSGSASYDVAPGRARTFVVRVGDVEVRVLGTAFHVEKLERAVRVVVTRGRVAVTRGEREVVLVAGEEVVMADEGPLVLASSATAEPVASVATATALPPLEQAPSSDSAEAVPSSAPSSEATAAELFRKADEARAGGRPEEAVQLLRDLVLRFPKDGRVTLAVFTIGRIEARRGRYADAAQAFESCGTALSGEALAEAALMRSASGASAKARLLALRYLELFPKGARRQAMEGLSR